jgi:Domain of unknown function (DUF4131)
LLWAALAFAAGIATGVHAWRPPLWWLVAWAVFTWSGVYWFRRRSQTALVVGLGSLFLLGALLVQVRGPEEAENTGVLRFADGTELMVTAHVTREGPPQEDGPGSVRQRIEVETEQIVRDGECHAVNSGLRLNAYEQAAKKAAQSDQDVVATHTFRYGERLRFPAKVLPPRNYRDPGAFDYRGYLAENGIVALASTKAANVEILPGFAGSPVEL